MSPTTIPGKLILAKDYPADADVKAYVAAVEAADELDTPGIGALEPAVIAAYDNFIVGCKADGIWNAIKASCILAGARTLSGALVPLAGTAPNKFGTAANWNYDRKDGLQGDGSTNYLNSNRSANADPQNSNHGFVYVTTAPTALCTHLGNLDGSYYSGIIRLADGRLLSIANVSTSLAVGGIEASPAGDRTGAIGVSRNNSADYDRRSGSITTTVALASVASSVLPTFIFARNNSGSPDLFSNGSLAFYSIGESLDLAALDTRVSTLISDLGAAIP